MALSVGYGQVFNEETGKYEEVLISTKASEIVFADGQSLQYKMESGQLNGKDGRNGTDGKDGADGKDASDTITVTDLGRLTVANACKKMNQKLSNKRVGYYMFTATDFGNCLSICIWFKKDTFGAGFFVTWNEKMQSWVITYDSSNNESTVCELSN